MKIEQSIKKLDNLITKTYDEYIQAHRSLDKFRGQEITDDILPHANKALSDIQSKFADLYPALHFIAYRHQWATNATGEYEDFIKTIQNAGAAKVDKDGNTIVQGH